MFVLSQFPIISENLVTSITVFSHTTIHLQLRDCRSELLAGLNLLRCCAPGQGLYPHMHSLDPGVGEYLVGQGRFLCLNGFCVLEMAAMLYAPWELQ